MKVIKVDEESITFDDGTKILSNHDGECCEEHYLSFKNIELKDFDGMEFNLSNDSFFERVEGFGIRLVAKNNQKISIPGYGYNNGYYSDDLELVIKNDEKGFFKEYDITKCQEIFK